MRTRSWQAAIVWCCALTSCGVEELPVSNGQGAKECEPRGLFITPLKPEEIEKYWPIASFARFPSRIRRQLQAWHVENGACEPGSSFGQRACNRRRQISIALASHGWCWGGGLARVDDHWLRCSEIANLEPGEYEAQGDFFSEWSIRWLENRERLERCEPGVGPLPPDWDRLLPSRVEALAAPLTAEERERHPLSSLPPAGHDIRSLMQRYEIYGERGSRIATGPTSAEGMRAANARFLVEIELERRAWCDRGRNGGWQHCTSDPDYLPGQIAAWGELHPQSYIEFMARLERRWARQGRGRQP